MQVSKKQKRCKRKEQKDFEKNEEKRTERKIRLYNSEIQEMLTNSEGSLFKTARLLMFEDEEP